MTSETENTTLTSETENATREVVAISRQQRWASSERAAKDIDKIGWQRYPKSLRKQMRAVGLKDKDAAANDRKSIIGTNSRSWHTMDSLGKC